MCCKIFNARSLLTLGRSCPWRQVGWLTNTTKGEQDWVGEMPHLQKPPIVLKNRREGEVDERTEVPIGGEFVDLEFSPLATRLVLSQ